MTDDPLGFDVLVADGRHVVFAEQICNEMAESAKARGTGIAKRSPEYVAQKMREGKAIIALALEAGAVQVWAGFCYIETWSHGEYVANSGLIVAPKYRKHGLAHRIKEKAFALSRTTYPEAKLFGLTTGLAVMKINSDLGYEPVTYSELTQDEQFWAGCQSCVNFDILTLKQRKNCLCTAMLWDPAEKAKDATSGGSTDANENAGHNPGNPSIGRHLKPRRNLRRQLVVFERLMRLKQYAFLKGRGRNRGGISALLQPTLMASRYLLHFLF